MIYGFQKIDHPITEFHTQISNIFEKIFKHDLENYDEEILIHPSFRTIVNSSKVRLERPIKEIVKAYHNLPTSAKIQLQEAFVVNNDLSSFSNIDKYLIKYEALHDDISQLLKDFYSSLWREYPLVNQIEEDFGTIKSHYDSLINEENFKALICPFCGTESFAPPEDNYREAYDHFFAKSEYPFISMNFDLLFPTCNKCNSIEKGTADPLYNDNGLRRKSYYPYDKRMVDEPIQIDYLPTAPYNPNKLETLLRTIPWEFKITRNGRNDEEIDTWDAVFRIKGRYSKFIHRLEKEWYSQFEKKFKREKDKGTSFANFQKEVLEDAEALILTAPYGILRFSYFKFLFAINDIENLMLDSVNN